MKSEGEKMLVVKNRLILPLIPEKKQEPKRKAAKLPPDTYEDILEPVRIPFNDTRHIVISTKRSGELGILSADIRWYATTEKYSGFTKKGITISALRLQEVIESLTAIQAELVEMFPDECEDGSDDDEIE